MSFAEALSVLCMEHLGLSTKFGLNMLYLHHSKLLYFCNISALQWGSPFERTWESKDGVAEKK